VGMDIRRRRIGLLWWIIVWRRSMLETGMVKKGRPGRTMIWWRHMVGIRIIGRRSISWWRRVRKVHRRRIRILKMARMHRPRRWMVRIVEGM